MDDLVERLRHSMMLPPGCLGVSGILAKQAAARIEKLEAENAELQHQIEIRDAAAVSRATITSSAR